MTRPNAAVVGIGVSGQAAAVLLDQYGYAVTCFDQSATEVPAALSGTVTALITVADPVKMGEAI